MCRAEIQILLSTYNGELYLEELLDSLIHQTFHNWQLLIRDDGSTDQTGIIIERFLLQYPRKFIQIQDADHKNNICLSYNALLRSATAPYLMFCDQDDVWYPEKIALSYQKMRDVEKKSPGKPIIIHSDLEVVDRNLETVSHSLWEYHRIDPDLGYDHKNLLAYNVVTGCTMMINQPAKLSAIPIPAQAYMHDWWIAIHVSRTGFIEYIDLPLIKYRIHALNASGTYQASRRYFMRRVFQLRSVFVENLKIFRMLRLLDFKVNWRDVVITKLRITACRVIHALLRT